MKVVTDGKTKWFGEDKVNTGKGTVDVSNPPEWATVFDAMFLDKLEKMKRGPQAINQKDVGAIISLIGLGADWRIAEGGSGSGYLTAWLARFVKQVYSYEIRKDHLEIAKENAEWLGLKNIEFKNKSIFELEESDLDLVFYDLPNPWDGVSSAYNSLKIGGYFVAYLPTAPQVEKWLRATRQFSDHRVITSVWWDWKTEPDKFRPRSKTLAHTAFICVARKFKSSNSD